jgi:hypothetical protein
MVGGAIADRRGDLAEAAISFSDLGHRPAQAGIL